MIEAALHTKRCTKCGAEKPLEEFAYHPHGLHRATSRCKACLRAYRKERYRQQLALNPNLCAETNLRHKYRMSLADYDRMLTQQGGKCAVCKTTHPGGRGRFAVDHDHATGAVRALLCNRCNRGMGVLGDDPERLEAAARYLRAFQRG